MEDLPGRKFVRIPRKYSIVGNLFALPTLSFYWYLDLVSVWRHTFVSVLGPRPYIGRSRSLSVSLLYAVEC